MSSALSTQEIYSLSHSTNLGGIEGYHVEKKHFDPLKQIEERRSATLQKGQKSRKHVTKRGNFLDDEANMHKQTPGPGKYQYQDEWPEKKRLKISYPDKQTFLDQLIKQ